MSQEILATVVERALIDPSFRAQLQTDPYTALAGYDLSEDERSALVARDTQRVRAMGVDARLSKFAQQNPSQEQDAMMDFMQGLMR